MSNLTEQEKIERKNKAAQNRANSILAPRAGTNQTATAAEENRIEITGYELSDIVWFKPEELRPHGENLYAPLLARELEILTQDIKEKGVLVPLIIKGDNTILCGHNRREAAIKAGIEKVPCQVVAQRLTREQEHDIMRSENDKRRGGKWSVEQKIEFVRQNFKEELLKDERGGDRKSDQGKVPKGPSKVERISEASRGKLSKADVKRAQEQIRLEENANKPKTKEKKEGVKAVKKDEKNLKITITMHDIKTFRKGEREVKTMLFKKFGWK